MEEIVINPEVPRYSRRPLPPYRYQPFRAGTMPSEKTLSVFCVDFSEERKAVSVKA